MKNGNLHLKNTENESKNPKSSTKKVWGVKKDTLEPSETTYWERVIAEKRLPILAGNTKKKTKKGKKEIKLEICPTKRSPYDASQKMGKEKTKAGGGSTFGKPLNRGDEVSGGKKKTKTQGVFSNKRQWWEKGNSTSKKRGVGRKGNEKELGNGGKTCVLGGRLKTDRDDGDGKLEVWGINIYKKVKKTNS